MPMLLTCLPGSAFASTGDDGILRVWKKDMTGSFIEFAELGAT